MSTQYTPGRFVWFELMTQRPKDAVRFYTEVMGWKHTRSEYGDMPYDLLGPDEMVAGIMPSPRPEAPNHWQGYLSTEDVDLTHKQAMDNGGAELQRPFDMPGVGRISALRDPQGGTFYLLSREGGDHPPKAAADSNGYFRWAELWARDPLLAVTFYQQVFDLDVGYEERVEGPYWTLSKGGVPVGGVKKTLGQLPPMWIQFVQVDDVDTTLVRVRQQGGLTPAAPINEPGVGRCAIFQDAVGAMQGIVRPYEVKS